MMVTVLVPGAGPAAGGAGGADWARRRRWASGLHSCADPGPSGDITAGMATRGLAGGNPVLITAAGSPPSGSSTISAQPTRRTRTGRACSRIAVRDRKLAPLFLGVLTEGSAQFVVATVPVPCESSIEGRSRIVNSSFTSRLPSSGNAAGRPFGRPVPFLSPRSAQFAARLGLGGNAACVVTPRMRSNAYSAPCRSSDPAECRTASRSARRRRP